MAPRCIRDNFSSFIRSSKRSIGVSSPPSDTAIFAAGLAPTVALRLRVFDGFRVDKFVLLAQSLDLAGSAHQFSSIEAAVLDVSRAISSPRRTKAHAWSVTVR